MREIDRVMIDELGIELVQMMELAGSSLARLAHSLYAPSTVAVYVGIGGNGGGGLAAARHLHGHGADVTVVMPVARERLAPVTRRQLGLVEAQGISVVGAAVKADLAIDALVGYSLRGALDEVIARTAETIRPASGGVISLDVPTGVDATTGLSDGLAVVPDATLTLCLPKTGLTDRAGTGGLFVADIGVPAELVCRISDGAAPPFALGTIVQLANASQPNACGPGS